MKRCLLVAPLVSHATAGRIAAIGAGGCEVDVADISTRPVRHSMALYPYSLIRKRFDLDVKATDPLFGRVGPGSRVAELLRSAGLREESRAISERVRNAVKDSQPDVIVLFYGPAAIHFGRIIRRSFPDMPLIIIHNTFPTSVERSGLFARAVQAVTNTEFSDYRQWLKRMNFFVYASAEMAQFAQRRFGIDPAKTAVLPDYFPGAMQAQTTGGPNTETRDAPRVIFLGAPERWGNAIDDLDAELFSIASERISVSAGEMSEDVMRTGYGFKYPYFSDDEVFRGALAQYAHGFDAALITYAAPRRLERFRSTLPTRFFTALSAGIPIAVRAGIFDAVETYVRTHGLGFAYHGPADLRERLGRRDELAAMRRNAVAHLPVIAAEKQAGAFEAVFERCLHDETRVSRRGLMSQQPQAGR